MSRSVGSSGLDTCMAHRLESAAVAMQEVEELGELTQWSEPESLMKATESRLREVGRSLMYKCRDPKHSSDLEGVASPRHSVERDPTFLKCCAAVEGLPIRLKLRTCT